MIDLPTARALAARARENTSEGLTAREALPEIVDGLLEMLGEPEIQWAAQSTAVRDGKPGLIKDCDDRQDACDFIECLPENVRGHWCVVSRIVHRYIGPWAEEPRDV